MRTVEDSRKGERRVLPALLTRMSMVSSCLTIFLTALTTDFSSVTSKAIAVALQPIDRIFSATAAQASALRELMMTCAPACARPAAIPAPSPIDEPVTSATLPVRSNRPVPERPSNPAARGQRCLPPRRLDGARTGVAGRGPRLVRGGGGFLREIRV